MLTALLDTSVLWPSLQRDLLLSLAAEGLYRQAWSQVVLAELEYQQTVKLVRRSGLDPQQARARASALVARMRTAFADAEVTGWEPLEGAFALPDPDDEHVVAAAVVAGAGVVVTSNTRDFPPARLPESLEVLPPAAFALRVVSLDPALSRRAVEEIAARSGRHGPRLRVAGCPRPARADL